MEVHVELAAETLFHLGPIPVTNSMLTMFIVMAAILVVGTILARKAQAVPGRGQGIAELIVEFLLGLVEGTAGKRAGRRIFPLVGAIFIFIIFANYSGLLPGVGTIGYWHEEAASEEAAVSISVENADPTEGQVAGDVEAGADAEEAHERVLVPYFRSPNADLNMTLAMALLTFTVVQVAGIAAHGVRGRLKHLGDPPLLFPLEVISEVSRIISLSARLFGNIFAGEVLLAVMFAMANAIKIAIIPVLFPVLFLGLELLFGFVQALVFALLTLIYITLATAGHEEHEHGDEIVPEHGEFGPHGRAPLAAATGGD
ncbi:MAG: F0F1 ATP synthase subunit A [Chloroflexota bacterium]|nr:F0F1 ATP synthase subunit A [Chloroflexota bacterium]